MVFDRDWGKFRKLSEYVHCCRSAPTLQGAIAYSGYSPKRARERLKKHFPAVWARICETNRLCGDKKAKRARLNKFLREHDSFTAAEAAAETGYSIRYLRKQLRGLPVKKIAEEKRRKLNAFLQDHETFRIEEAAAASGYAPAYLSRILPTLGVDVDRSCYEKLATYVATTETFTIAEASRFSGYSTRRCSRVLRRFWPDKLEASRKRYREQQRARQTRLLAMIDANPYLPLHEYAACGLSVRYCATLFRTLRPDAWRGRTTLRLARQRLEEYKRAGGLPHWAVAKDACGYGEKVMRLLCSSDPYFQTSDAEFLTRYAKTCAGFRSWEPSRKLETLSRALGTRDALIAAGVETDGLAVAQEVGVDANEARVVAHTAGFRIPNPDQLLDRELERSVIAPPEEYLEDVRSRDCLGISLPKEMWDRYYRLYQERKAGKLAHGACPTALRLLG